MILIFLNYTLKNYILFLAYVGAAQQNFKLKIKSLKDGSVVGNAYNLTTHFPTTSVMQI